jgi:hypothetical protein
MAWYNINSSDGIAKEFDHKKRIARCGFCGQEKLIKTDKKIYFSEFEIEDRPICFSCYHQHSKKAVAK